ncbi:isochorismate synthase [Rhizobiaceae bacterium BDR2-2]|uniref:isochorismate synthase n=1 Tax=Ectorhizobium quercum TaxID=2965071 RepID=A0AAE3SUG4_9HYPH|nr:isochorismate synthase [Ectorhizobium quercum]MCX8995979.1 isochorismate synthase [Ectorhizobium quercum]
MLAGVLPFDREADDYLFQPAGLERVAGPQAAPDRAAFAGDGKWIVSQEPPAADYAAAVERVLEEIGRGGGEHPLQKVVLSRSLNIRASAPVDPGALLRRLSSDASTVTFSASLPSREGMPSRLIGATPELLVSRQGETIVSHPLAGSARRRADPAADRQSAEALERSDKDRREHRAAAEAVFDALAPYCSALSAPDGTALRATATMWHLGTRIVGRLRDRDTPVAELVAALHPTPAVCGLPRDRAAALIREVEGYDRDFYAGAVGWMDDRGDGEWYVALRCAQLSGSHIRLYAGAGIVAGSDPLAEVDETSAKFLAMLNALGVDEQGRPLGEKAA